MADYFQLLSAFAVVFLALYYYFTLTFDFWKDRGVNGPQPVPVFGNIKDIIMGKCALGTYTMKLYNEYKNEPMVGIFVRRSPHLVLIDLDRIKDVLIKDFSTFSNRATLIFERTEPLSAHLFNLETERWRPLRTRLSPVFTSGKIKDMFPLILECSNQLKECLEKIVEKDGLLDCREIAARFTTDVIGSCAFGISMNALSDEESEFRRMGKQIFKSNLATMLKELTDTLLAAQAFVFFAAGFETSSTTIGHALYEMALNHNIQDKLRQEINEFYAKNKGNWTYDDVKGMSYLDKVFKETLRKYPPGLLLRRKSINNYTFSGTKVSIPKDTAVLIPVYAIHKDPNIYPDPEVYDPERFNEDAVAARHPMAFLPFGDGPRNCIGARFAVYQTKIGLIQMLKNFKIDVCDETLIPYVQHPTSRVFAPIRSIILKISKV
ncbi:cytochrome P450 6a2-like isoform X2 [Osmia lignaria lignaria]|uniref:cytochrome P450 6a2-like isoform X2 n=1 Tax=Osmia lignaria lignaria TaxID=1437193 RepID=UPI00402B69EE